jgi:heat shock protein HspQ
LATFDLAMRPWVIVVSDVLPRRANEPPLWPSYPSARPFRQPHFHTVLESYTQTMVSVTH